MENTVFTLLALGQDSPVPQTTLESNQEKEIEEIEEIYNINLHREWLNPLPKDMLVVFLMAFHIHFFSLKTLVWMKY